MTLQNSTLRSQEFVQIWRHLLDTHTGTYNASMPRGELKNTRKPSKRGPNRKLDHYATEPERAPAIAHDKLTSQTNKSKDRDTQDESSTRRRTTVCLNPLCDVRRLALQKRWNNIWNSPKSWETGGTAAENTFQVGRNLSLANPLVGMCEDLDEAIIDHLTRPPRT